MPVRGRPLLDYWLQALRAAGVTRVLVNGHHHSVIVKSFLQLAHFTGFVQFVHEPDLLGTAATLRQNSAMFADNTTLLVHADNLVNADMDRFMTWHAVERPRSTDFTMMTFDTSSPKNCGIVELDQRGVVCRFHEKVANPPGMRANGAVYLLEPGVTEWIAAHPGVTDFSTQVIPQYLGKIATWHNEGVHRDIGTPAALCDAQHDFVVSNAVNSLDDWEFFERFRAVIAKVEQWCIKKRGTHRE